MNWGRLKTLNALGWFSVIVTTALCAVDELNVQGAGIHIPGWVFKVIAVVNAALKTVNTNPPPANPSLPPAPPEPLDRIK